MEAHLFLITAILLIGVLVSCDEQNEGNILNKENVTGYVQKGPFINGSSVTVSELNEDLSQTGNHFYAQIENNQGLFEIQNLGLASSFAELKADGFYFNEVTGENSEAQLTLHALSDLTDKSSMNVNILTSLEKKRVSYLVEAGSSFDEAKNQAQEEILKIFEIDPEDIELPELMDISKEGSSNAALLAISVIMQGHTTVAEMSELLAGISGDIKEDGTLDDESLGSALVNNVRYINKEEIRANLENRYEELGVAGAQIPEFETYIDQFIKNTRFELTDSISYPEQGSFGENLLYPDKNQYETDTYSVTAILPEGAKLNVKIQGNNWTYPVSQDWSMWSRSDWDNNDNSRTFTSLKTGTIEFKINTYSGTLKIYYYENGDLVATLVKTCYLGGGGDSAMVKSSVIF